MGMTVATIAMVSIAAYGAYSASRSADKADKQARALQKSSDWQRDLASMQWERYATTFAPLENKIVKESQLPVEQQPGFARMMGTIDRGYADTAANTRRTLGGRYPSGAGIETERAQNIDLGRTQTKAGAVADFSANRFNQMLQAANLGRNLPATSVGAGANAMAGYGNLANMYANAAKGSWDAVGGATGNLMQMYMLANQGMTPAASGGSGLPAYTRYYDPSTGNMADMGYQGYGL